MSAAATAKARVWTIEEYLAMERASEIKHEFFAGEIFAMAGAKSKHNLIAMNTGVELSIALRSRPCLVYGSDMRVKAPTGLYTYPDVLAVCSQPEFEDEQEDTLLNPLLIVEVLSESTENYDRGKKFVNYRTIPSLQDYVLVSQWEVLVEHLARQADGRWLLSILRAGDRLALPGVDCEIAVDDIFLKVFDFIGETAES